MDLGFLADKPAEKKAVKDMTYDKEIATIEQDEKKQSVIEQYPYLQRGVEYAWKHGFGITKNLKEAMIARTNGQLKLTIHESDIAFRCKINLSSNFMLLSFRKFGHFLTEEDYNFTQQVFLYRSRYNKGIEWRKTAYKNANETERGRGISLLHEIREFLEYQGIPLHEEEIENGVISEFLKPEHMTWDQFNFAFKSRTGNNYSITDKELIAANYSKFKSEHLANV